MVRRFQVLRRVGSSQRKPFLDRCRKIDSLSECREWPTGRGKIERTKKQGREWQEGGEGFKRGWETKLDRVVDEAANRRRVVPHWSNLRDHGTHDSLFLSFSNPAASVPAGIWHFDEFASNVTCLSVPFFLLRAVHTYTRADLPHRLRVKGTGCFLRGTFSIFERKLSSGRNTW